MENFNMQPNMMRPNVFKLNTLSLLTDKEIIEYALAEKKFYGVTSIEIDELLRLRNLKNKYIKMYYRTISKNKYGNIKIIAKALLLSSSMVALALILNYMLAQKTPPVLDILALVGIIAFVFFIIGKMLNIDKYPTKDKK
jgi:hypothetical protein